MRNVPCAKCSKPTPITDFCVEWIVRMNVILKKRNQPPLRKDEVALCGNRREGCYRVWQQELGRLPPTVNVVSAGRPTQPRDPSEAFR